MRMVEVEKGHRLPAHMIEGTPEFCSELDKRVADIMAGKVKCISHSELFDKLYDSLGVVRVR